MNFLRSVLRVAALALTGALILCSSPILASTDAPPVLTRFPTASADRIAFVAYGNLWTVALGGGPAARLTDDPGQVLAPHFSPDGHSIAFTWRREGGADVYVVPVSGGVPTRLTFGPTLNGSYDNIVTGWTPDGTKILFTSLRQSPAYHYETFAVSATGGLTTPLGLGPAGLSSLSPDGGQIAFDRTFRNLGGDQWKRYVGGQAPDIYIYDFGRKSLDRVTDWKGIDTAPMWAGHRLYFLSDRDKSRRANIWVTDLETKVTRQVTRFTDYDIDMPSIGPGGISFEQGGKLYLLDLPSESLHAVEVAVPADPRVAPHELPAAQYVHRKDFALSADGSTAIFSARGDLFAVVLDGTAVNLTRTPKSMEDHPAVSPDGRTLAFITDADGEQQVATMPIGGGAVRALTNFKSGLLYTPRWSPDGKWLAVADGNHGLWLVAAGGDRCEQVARDPAAEIRDARFSPDRHWLAYSTERPNQLRAIHLRDLATGQDTIVSSVMENDHDPAFSGDGQFLFFLSQRHELPIVSDRDREGTIATLKSDALYVTPLAADAHTPFGHPGSDTPAASHTTVNSAGLMARAVEVPIQAAGGIADLEPRGRVLFYRATPASGIGGDLPGEVSGLHAFDLDSGKDRTVTADVDGYVLSPAGEKALVRSGSNWHIVDVAPGATSDLAIKLDAMRVMVDPPAEAHEMFEQAWRLDRDLFWDPKMNGVDWRTVHDAYARLVPLVGSHEDMIYLLGELQGELSSSHMFLGGGDRGDPRPAVHTALLGADFALDAESGRYKFARVYRGDNSRGRFKAPLGDPALDVRDGDYLLAIDGQTLAAPADPYSLLLGKQGSISLTIARSATGPTRTIVIDTTDDEGEIRKLDWIDNNRAVVDRLSGGKVGYIYLSDFEELGSEDFIRQFYPQTDKQGLVIDVRGNRGGFTSQWVLDLLRRPRVGSFINREGAVTALPGAAAPRMVAVVTDIFSMSDGDQFPYFFRSWRLGKVVGERTWGGVRGIKGPWPLMDGTFVTVPKDSLRDLHGTSIIENRGSEPDIQVVNSPADLAAGHDLQLETAVRTVMPPRR
jgi:tricorn protease